jgi:hypothetical protein
LQRTGPGRNSDTRDARGSFFRNCHWSAPNERTIVDASVQICVTVDCVGGPVTAEFQRVWDKTQQDDRDAVPRSGFVYEKITVPGLDDALIVSTTAGPQVSLRGRTDNALIGVWLHLPLSAIDYTKRTDQVDLMATELLDNQRATVLALVEDVLDDLR